MKRLATAAALVGAVAIVTPAIAVPAHAETVKIPDKVGDDKGHDGDGDMKYVRVHYGADRIRFRIQWAVGATPEDFQDVYIDTRPKDPGPEVEVSLSGETERWYAGFVKNWKGSGWKDIDHGKVYYSFAHPTSGDSQYARFSIPRKAIRRAGHAQPKRIRVSVNDVFETGAIYDSVPGHKKWSRWIHWK